MHSSFILGFASSAYLCHHLLFIDYDYWSENSGEGWGEEVLQTSSCVGVSLFFLYPFFESVYIWIQCTHILSTDASKLLIL